MSGPASPGPEAFDRSTRVATALVVLSLVAFWPGAATPAFSLRMATVALVAVVALTAVSRSGPTVGPRRLIEGSIVALAGWMALSALLAAEEAGLASVVGRYGRGTGAVMWMITAALVVAVGRWTDRPDRSVADGVIIGAVVNAAVMAIQTVVVIGFHGFELVDGRAPGLLGNPVFGGALVAAALPLAATSRWSVGARLAIVAGLAAAVQLSGSRIALAAGAIVVVTVGLAREPRWRGRAMVVAALVVGLAAGAGLAALSVESTSDATERFGADGAAARGISLRMQAWRDGLDATGSAPVVGWGPARYEPATASERTFTDAERIGADSLFDDAHNLFVEMTVAGGVVGLGLVVGWFGSVGRWWWRTRRRWDPAVLGMAGATTVLGAAHMVQPLHIALTPLLFVMAAVTVEREPAPPAGAGTSGWRRWLTVASITSTALVVAIGAGALVVGDLAARTAVLDFDRTAAQRASRLLAPWGDPLLLESKIERFQFRTGATDDLGYAVELARRAHEREPDRARFAEAWAAAALEAGRRTEAGQAAAIALELNPWSPTALSVAARLTEDPSCAFAVAAVTPPSEDEPPLPRPDPAAATEARSACAAALTTP